MAMSKKKSFSGSTMTLRDFHGGSIPPQLPLPSAPGMTIERNSHDRPNSGGWMGSSLNRGYGGQGSGSGARSFEDKAFFFPNPANIGRNYDEDERKPVDGQSRRSQGADSFEEQMYDQRQTVYDRKPDRFSLESRGSFGSSKYGADGYVQEVLGLIPVGPSPKPQSQDLYQLSQAAYAQGSPPPHSVVSQELLGQYQPQPTRLVSQYASQQFQESASPWRKNNTTSQQPAMAGLVTGSGSGAQNVWTARKEGELNRSYSAELGASNAMGGGVTQVAALRAAQASALEKVSSGRWNSRMVHPSVEQPTGEYAQLQGQSYGGRGVDVRTDLAPDSVHARYSAESGQAVYNDSVRSGYNELARAGQTESRTSRVSRSDVGQGSPLNTKYGEQYGEGRARIALDSSSEWADCSSRYQESGEGNLSDCEPGRNTQDNFGYGYGEAGWRGNAVHRDSAKSVGTGNGASADPGPTRGFRDPARFGDEASAYIEPGNISRHNSGSVGGQWPPSRGDNTDTKIVDASRGVASDTGNRGYSNQERMDPVTGSSSFSPSDGFGPYRSEGHRGSHHDGPHSVYYNEEVGQQTYGYPSGRDHSSRGAPKSPYVSDAPKGVHVNERNRGARAAEVDRNLPVEDGRLETSRGVRGSSLPSVGASETERKSVPAERPKLKLLPRTKPLEADLVNEAVQEGSGTIQDDSDNVQSIRAFPSENISDFSSVTVAANVSVFPSLNEDEDDPVRIIERPKLNLKPRSQPAEEVPDRRYLKERMSLFGGARPRELVLKERGVDESLIVGVDNVATPGASVSGLRPTSGGDRLSGANSEYNLEKYEEQKLDGKHSESHEGGGNSRQTGRFHTGRLERKESRGRKDGWFDLDEKEERRGGMDHHHLQERREPDRPDVDKQDNWRRPTETLKSPLGSESPSTVIGTGELSRGPGRLGISSAAELAQAFSRSASLGSGQVLMGTPRGQLGQQSPIPRSPGSGVGLGYDSPVNHSVSSKGIPFSRLTEAVTPGPRDVYATGVQGGYRRTNAY